MVQTILMALVAGAIVGPLARLILPGRQAIGVPMTVLLGAVGSLIGAYLYKLATGRTDTPGIDWIAGFIGVLAAAALILVFAGMSGRRQH